MNTTRLLKWIFVSALMIAALVALGACTPSITASGSGQTSVGMGDLHRFESRASNPAYTGMGDLHRYEAQASNPGSAVETSDPSYAGMGDLHRFEAQSSGTSYAGMGDLHRFEAGQEIQYPAESNSPPP
jgi:hypothetical protein